MHFPLIDNIQSNIPVSNPNNALVGRIILSFTNIVLIIYSIKPNAIKYALFLISPLECLPTYENTAGTKSAIILTTKDINDINSKSSTVSTG